MKVMDTTPNGTPAHDMICTVEACGKPGVVVLIDDRGDFTGDAACGTHVHVLVAKAMR